MLLLDGVGDALAARLCHFYIRKRNSNRRSPTRRIVHSSRGPSMWEQYRKTLFRIQGLIIVVSLIVMSRTREPGLAAMIFMTMQVGALVGALWGRRLKERFGRAA